MSSGSRRLIACSSAATANPGRDRRSRRSRRPKHLLDVFVGAADGGLLLQVDLRPRDLRPRVVGFAGTLFPYSFHQAVSASIAGPSPRAFRVISYSTRGGTSANTVHEISVPALLIANVERLRISILQVGLLITAAIVILWFAKR
jgi:hypothetical protein